MANRQWIGAAGVLAAVLAEAGPAAGQGFTWDGGSGVSSNWSQSFNWVGNLGPTSGVDTQIQFAGTTRLDPVQNLANPFLLNRLQFAADAGAFVLSGDPLDFRTSATFGTPLVVQQSAAIVAVANELRLTATLTVDGGGTGTVRLDGPLVGAASLVKNGGFGLVLGGANAGWTGNLIVTDGFVSAADATALTGNNVTIHRGGRLAVLADVTVGNLALTNNVTSSATTGPSVTTPNDAELTLGGTVTYVPAASGSSPEAVIEPALNLGSATRTFNIGRPTTGAIEFATEGAIRGTGATTGVLKTGEGRWLARSGSWTFSGATQITNGGIQTGAVNVLSPNSSVVLSGDGELELGPSGGGFDQRIGGLFGPAGTEVVVRNATLTVGANNADATFDGVLTSFIGQTGTLVKVGTGTQTLTGTHTISAVEVRQGTLAVTQNGSLGTLSASPVVRAGGTLRATTSFSTARTFDLSAGGAISVDATRTLTYFSGAIIDGGFLRGLGTHSLAAGSRAEGTAVLAGTKVSLAAGATLANVTMGGNLTLTGTGSRTWDGGRLTESGVLTIGSGATLAVSQWSSTGVTTIAGGTAVTSGWLNNTGSPLVLGGGSRTFVGSTAVRGGTIHLGGQPLELNGGLLVNNGDFLGAGVGGIQNGTVNVNYGSLAKGTGYYEAVNVTEGGKFAPGNSITNTTSGTLTLNSGSVYEFEINRALGTAGGGDTPPPAGWDLLNLIVALNVNSTAASPATIELVSRNTNDTAGGTLPDFDPAQPYQWLAFHISDGGTINGFSADKFVFDTSRFNNLTNPAGVGTFSLSRSGNEVFVTYTPVPEATAVLPVVAAALGVGALARRRRTDAAA